MVTNTGFCDLNECLTFKALHSSSHSAFVFSLEAGQLLSEGRRSEKNVDRCQRSEEFKEKQKQGIETQEDK